uniref:AAA ATPase AAA+ lid domain-containing protein n=1 Tax=Physcomitrium patens TaxID=3218 RepID=A0A2K1JPE5_PHYPA|nr:hypothetical protein PHYPA_015778 [Physcomitrium patens]
MVLNKYESIIVVCATNFLEFIDKALIQPSQFDWNVEIPNLDVEGRCQTLEARMNKVPKSGDVGLSVIARGTPGFSGADLANLINVVALKATINGQKDVSMANLEFAKDKIMMGSGRKSVVISERSRRLSAFHEGGHALVLPDKDETSFSRKQMLARLDVCIGGRVEEELVFWEGETAYENAKRIHTTHQRELHTLAATFLERETMTAGEIKASLTQVKEQVNRSNIPLASPQPIISATTVQAA